MIRQISYPLSINVDGTIESIKVSSNCLNGRVCDRLIIEGTHNPSLTVLILPHNFFSNFRCRHLEITNFDKVMLVPY